MSSPHSSLLRDMNRGGAIDNFDEEWAKTMPVVLRLLNQEPVSKAEWQGLFFSVHSLVSWVDKGAEKIQGELYKEVLSYVTGAENRIRKHQEENALLRSYISEWQKYFTQAHYFPMPFYMLDSSVGGNSKSPNVVPKNRSNKMLNEESLVRKMMLETWNRIIFSSIKEKLQAAAMKLVAAERNGEAFDSQLVVGVRESYVSLSTDMDDRFFIYRENFERAYLNATEEFYRSRAANILEENGVQIYMEYADTKLREEEQRADRYLETTQGSNSVQTLLSRCVDVLVVAFQEQILAECPALIKQNQIEKLQLMFRLLNRTPTGIKPMLQNLEDHIRHQGLADMVANAENITSDPEKYVEQLLDMFHKFSRLVNNAFYNDPRFLTSRDKAFQEVVNDTTVFKIELPQSRTKGQASKVIPESKCPELLANYCDLLLRKTQISRKLTSEDVDSRLGDVLLVLKYVQNKDVFMRFHKAHLARRLILDMTADQEKEEMMINRLREAGMPADYVNKLYRMLQDIEVNKDLNKHFKSMHYGSNNNRNTMADMVNIKILNAGAWSRGGDRIPVSLPRELEDFIPEVEDFYKKQHNGRKLQWLHHWSNGTIQFQNREGKYDLEVTTFQMALLFCWNERPLDKISYENLRLATELPDIELKKTLWSLISFPKLKHQVLGCSDDIRNPKDFSDSTLFWPNQEFTLIKNGKPQPRGRVNLIGRLQLSAEQSREQEHDDILQLRILRVQEAIVKILKMRKRVQSAQLQTELVEMLKHMFLPSRKMIKEQLEWLMDQKYLKRDEEDMNIFVYLA